MTALLWVQPSSITCTRRLSAVSSIFLIFNLGDVWLSYVCACVYNRFHELCFHSCCILLQYVLFFCRPLFAHVSACLFPLMYNRIPPRDRRWRRAFLVETDIKLMLIKVCCLKILWGKIRGKNLEFEAFQQCSDGIYRRAACEGWCCCTTPGRVHFPLVEWPVEQTDERTWFHSSLHR